MRKIEKEYIGDSVYVDYDGRFILTTNNGFGDTNTIVLEPEVMKSLYEYAENVKNINHLKYLETKKKLEGDK